MNMLLKYVEKKTPTGGRSSVQLVAEKGKEPFYEKLGFKTIPNEFCGSGTVSYTHLRAINNLAFARKHYQLRKFPLVELKSQSKT